MTEVELGRMDLGRNQYVVSLELGIFQGRPKSIRPNSETVKIRPMAQEADSTHFFRPISVHPLPGRARSRLMHFIMLLPIILHRTSPIPIGRTPGHLSSAISRHAL